jgi:hypothetical protein
MAAVWQEKLNWVAYRSAAKYLAFNSVLGGHRAIAENLSDGLLQLKRDAASHLGAAARALHLSRCPSARVDRRNHDGVI